jgi:hypothetical protein
LTQLAAAVQIAMPTPLGRSTLQQYWPVGQSAVAAQFCPKKVHVEVAAAKQLSSRALVPL